MDWLKAATESLTFILVSEYEITGSKELAIEKAKKLSTAGTKTWEIVISNLRWEV